MRQILTEEWLQIPDYVEVAIKSRKVTVKGERGSVTKDLSHMSVEMQIMKQDVKNRKGNFIRLRMWFGQYKLKAQVRTVLTLVKNMIVGVSEVSSVFPSRLLSHLLHGFRACGVILLLSQLACQFN